MILPPPALSNVGKLLPFRQRQQQQLEYIQCAKNTVIEVKKSLNVYQVCSCEIEGIVEIHLASFV